MESGTAETSTRGDRRRQTAPAAAAPSSSRSTTRPPASRSRRSRSTPRRAVAETVARVRANQAEWEAIGIEGRYHWLGKLRDWLLDNHERVLDTMQAETGKVRADASNEPVYLTDLINFYGTKAAKFIGEESVRPHSPLLAAKKLSVQYRPHPVVGIISPWNFPLVLALGDAIPALQAGAAVVIKPSEFTPLGLAEVVEAWKEEIGGPDVSTACRDRRDRRRPGRRRRLRPIHRLRPNRAQGDGARRRDADPGQPRARRQGPDDRPLRRRPRPGRQRGGLGRDDELRPDLHLGRADLRRGARLRRVRRQADQRGGQAAPGRRRPQAPKRTSAR